MSAGHRSQERPFSLSSLQYCPKKASKTPVGEPAFTIETSPTQNSCRFVCQRKDLFYSILLYSMSREFIFSVKSDVNFYRTSQFKAKQRWTSNHSSFILEAQCCLIEISSDLNHIFFLYIYIRQWEKRTARTAFLPLLHDKQNMCCTQQRVKFCCRPQM